MSVICCGSKITYTKAFRFGRNADSLRNKQCINRSCHERQEIIITRLCVPQPAPLIKPVEISAECKNNRCFSNHTLIKMQWSKFLFSSLSVTMTLYTCILPVVEARHPIVSSSVRSLSSTGSEEYFRIVLRSNKIRDISVILLCCGLSNKVNKFLYYLKAVKKGFYYFGMN